jgi:ribokinase
MAGSKSKIFDVVGIGLCCVDYISLVEEFPAPDSKIEALETSIQGGGPVPTAVCTASQLGAKTSYIGLIGADSDGQFIREELGSFGVDTSCMVERPDTMTSRAFILADITHGTRSVVLSRNRSGGLAIDDVSVGLLERTMFLHLDGRDIEVDLEAARTVRRCGGEVSLDVGSPREIVEPLLACADHLVVSKAFAFEYCGSHDPHRCIETLRKNSLRSCVVTCGTDGAYGWAAGAAMMHQAAFSAGRVVDTTGAGDVYHGAYLFGLIKRWGLKRRMEFASAAAALKCRKIGGREGIPTISEIESLTQAS